MIPRAAVPPRQHLHALVAVALLALARVGAAQAPAPAGQARAAAVQPPAATVQGRAAAGQGPAVGGQAPAEALAGQVVDSAGKPVADQRVFLHRVEQSNGAMVDSAVSDNGGRFTLHLPAIAAAQDTGAVYIVATRWQGQLYVGSPFKRPVPAGAPYLVAVGVNPVQMGPAAGQAAGGSAPAAETQALPTPPSSNMAGRWFLAIILGLVALGAVGYALVSGTRSRAAQRRRVLLTRIAELDERADAALPDEAARLRAQRAELVSQLADE